MGWLEGLLTGYADTMGDMRKENARQAELSAAREGEVYKLMLNSEDPTIRGMAATGLLSSTQPKRVKSGFGGWMGQMESDPMYPTLMKYITTPQPTTTTTTEAGLPSKQTQGFLPQSTLRVSGQESSLAQPTTSPTEGEGMAKPQPLPGSVTPPPTPPGVDASALPSRATLPFYDDALGDAQGHPAGQQPRLGAAAPAAPALSGPPPALPAAVGTTGTPGTPGTPESQGPHGFPTSPEGTRFVQQLQPPTSPSNGGWWLDDKGQQWTMQDDQIIKAGQRPVTPPPAPPSLSTQPLTPGPTITRQQTTMALPQVFPTAGQAQATLETTKMHAEVRQLQEEYRMQGAPDWQKRGLDAYMLEHGRMVPGVNEGDSQPVSGPVARQLGVPDGTWMQPLYDKMTGNVIRWIPAAAKGAAAQALKPEDEVARAMGLPNSQSIPPDRLAEFREKVNALKAGTATATTTATSNARYAAEKARVDPANVENYADLIAGDVSKTGSLLSGRSQAFKDAVAAAITRGRPSTGPNDPGRQAGNVNKISEATRQMAETAKDILPVMDTIAGDAQTFDKLGMMGPVQGRWQDFLLGKIGVTQLAGNPADPNYAAKVAIAGKFRTEVDLLEKAVLRAHAGARGAGSPEGLDRIEGMLNSSHMDLGTFLSSMSGFKVWMDQYAKHLPDFGTPGQEPDSAGAAPPPPPQLPAAPDQALGAAVQKYGASAAGRAAAPAASPAASGFSPQFRAPLLIDASGRVVR